MNFKKKLFSWITHQKNNSIGVVLGRITKTISHALENKNNDNNLSGEYRIWEVLKNQPIHTIFDVGANVGEWSKYIAGKLPDAEIHTFEPVEETCKRLKGNTISLPTLKVNNFALSDKKEEIQFNYYPSGSYFSSIYNNQLGKEAQKLTIACVTGDDYCLENGINQIHFLKIDTEGSEHKVLKGFTRMLSEGKIKIIQFEYGDMCIDSGFLLKNYFQLLESCGFYIGKIYPKWIEFGGYNKGMENFILSNFLAIHKSQSSLIYLDF